MENGKPRVTRKPCPACGETVSPKAFDCPHCGHPLRTPQRGPAGLLAKWLLILFNIGMLCLLVAYLVDVGERLEGMQTEAERTGTGLGALLGVGALVLFWAVGDVILGLAALLTRPRR